MGLKMSMKNGKQKNESKIKKIQKIITTTRLIKTNKTFSR
jgi:hypothetical protein